MRFFTFMIMVFLWQMAEAQQIILLVGNSSKICDTIEGYKVEKKTILPSDLSDYGAILIFSTANSQLQPAHLDSLEQFLASGKGIYLGSENWPLIEESNYLTSKWYSKNTWGEFDEEKAMVSKSNLFELDDSIPAGKTTVSFPLDYRLSVDAWVNDEPLIQSGELLGGRIIIDGGYSRFFCETIDEEKKEILKVMIEYLISKP